MPGVPRPVLGVIGCERALGSERAQIVIERYFEAAARYADCAIVLVPSRPDLMSAGEIADRIDGILLTGSPSNVAPYHYGEKGGAGPFDPGRDRMSFDLIDAMIARERPVFGVCRGFQEINVAFGGSLRGDLVDPSHSLAHHHHSEEPIAEMFDHRHPVTLSTGGRLFAAIDEERIIVNSAHFQGVARLGTDLDVEAVAPDGIVEGVSARVGGSLVMAVQWHPEWQIERDPASQAFFAMLGTALRDAAT